jgi:hypothetical protein
MSGFTLVSVQSYKCSDRYGAEIDCGTSTPTRGAAKGTSAPTGGAARFHHRALHPLRQTGLSLCRGQRSRSKVLPVGEFSGQTTADGLRTAGARAPGSRVRGKPAAGTRGFGADLRDQSRALTPARGALRGRGERGGYAHRTDRSTRHGLAPRQHARELGGGTAEINSPGGRP